MLQGFLIIIGCQLLGEIAVSTGNLPIPAPVIGMVILFIGLLLKGGVPKSLDLVGGTLVKYIGLLFVPAGAGISMYIGLISEQWITILSASLSATILTLLIGAFTFQMLAAPESEDGDA